MSAAAATHRRTAADRHRDVLRAAVGVFAQRGYAAPTAVIARRAEVSEAYLYRLFTTKRALFLACHEAVQQRVRAVLADGAGDGDPDGGEPMLEAYRARLSADERRLQLQVHAAAADPQIRAAAQAGLLTTLEHIVALRAGDRRRAFEIYGDLMLINLADLLDPISPLAHGAPDARSPSA